MVVIIAALLFSPNDREPMTVEPTRDIWPQYELRGDKIELSSFLRTLADMHCPEWRYPLRGQLANEWRLMIQDARINGSVIVTQRFIETILRRIYYFRKQLPKEDPPPPTDVQFRVYDSALVA